MEFAAVSVECLLSFEFVAAHLADQPDILEVFEETMQYHIIFIRDYAPEARLAVLFERANLFICEFANAFWIFEFNRKSVVGLVVVKY